MLHSAYTPPMPSIPLHGGPHDGASVDLKFPTASIRVPFVHLDEDDSDLVFEALTSSIIADYTRVRHHIYNLSPCGQKYLHTSLVHQN